MPKTEYEIDDRQFHIEKSEKEWVGRFLDEPGVVFSGERKRDVLDQAGYQPRHSGGISVSFGTDFRQYSRPKSMNDAYLEFRQKLKNGHRPKISTNRPLNKFDILARDQCRCLYCGTIPDRSEDAHLDHIVPYDAGGHHIAGNIAIACAPCNRKKKNRRLEDEAEWLQEISERNRQWGIINEQPVGLPPRL